ncbi:MAG: deoxyguanosinetriphosphate triphosphohydrolase [Hyphomicrobiaceae bacterium]|nr:deoxyguanosinetriphosphate triphosphohydrolase [Hyphomicrobiaceae bacterium]
MAPTKPRQPLPAEDFGASLAPGERRLAPYAASAIATRGRQHTEPDCPARGPFQRDRDRVLHSAPFRRLTYKTQVFVVHEGDHYRTRLTHSLEVAQIARTMARQLCLDEDLAEALALAHDLGHSPFGHAGERALDRAASVCGGFDHNAQSLRIVTRLERKYRAFDGLNLTWETLEGLAKHNGPVAETTPGGHPHAVAKVANLLAPWRSLELATHAAGEAQVAAIADDIAYVNHDIDDALRAGLLTIADLAGAPLVGNIAARVLAAPDADRARAVEPARIIYEITRAAITAMIADAVGETRRRLAGLAPATADHIRAAGTPIVAFSSGMAAEVSAVKAFLFARVYRHPNVMAVMGNAERIVEDLFARFLASPDLLPAGWAEEALARAPRRRARLVADYVAGMTDRLAIAEHRRLFDATPELR